MHRSQGATADARAEREDVARREFVEMEFDARPAEEYNPEEYDPEGVRTCCIRGSAVES